MHWDKHVLITIIELLFHWLSQNNTFIQIFQNLFFAASCVCIQSVFSLLHTIIVQMCYVYNTIYTVVWFKSTLRNSLSGRLLLL